MNFVVAILLLIMAEEDAFWLLASIVEDVLPGFYHPSLIGVSLKAYRYCRYLLANLRDVVANYSILTLSPLYRYCRYLLANLRDVVANYSILTLSPLYRYYRYLLALLNRLRCRCQHRHQRASRPHRHQATRRVEELADSAGAVKMKEPCITRKVTH